MKKRLFCQVDKRALFRGARDGTRTHTALTTRTSNVLVYHSNTLASRFAIISLLSRFVNNFLEVYPAVVFKRGMWYSIEKSRGETEMARFFMAAHEVQEDRIILQGENAAHAKVLRLKPGEIVTVCDGETVECKCSVLQADNEYVLNVLERTAPTTEPSVKVSIYMAFSKGDKLEHVIQKATELGAYEIVAFPSARCISKPDEKSIAKKLDRWQKIAASAAEQSGRGVIPKVIALSSFQTAIERAATADTAILFYENERGTTLHQVLDAGTLSSVSLMTGPEGGLEQEEVRRAQSAGLQICTLGSRILRCETAPLCALSAVMYHTGEF